jgi:DNA-binding NarL/FixJ family response regulator
MMHPDLPSIPRRRRRAAGHERYEIAGARALRILIADDHAQVRKVVRDLLEARPQLQVVGEASDGLEAVEQARALVPDVILMDISMPRMDGVEATRRIHAELPSIRIYGLSVHLRTEDLPAIQQVGAAGFFTKGFDTQRLIEHLLQLQMAIAPDRVHS